jgi:hypothetical protein
MPSEEDIAGSSYILSFMNDIENLTNSYAGYLNVLVRIKDRYGLDNKDKEKKKESDSEHKLEGEDENALLSVAETLRVWIARCYVKASTLQDKIPEMKKGIGDIKSLYEKAISSSVIEKEVAESFVLQINKMFVGGVLKSLLLKSQDIYREVLK